MNIVEGRIRKIESLKDSSVFYDFEFWGENDVSTDGLTCFSRLSAPSHLIIVEMNKTEYSIDDIDMGIEALKERVVLETGYHDLVYPNVKRYIEQRTGFIDRVKYFFNPSFKNFSDSYKKSIAIYEDVFNDGQEALEIGDISISEFRNLKGKIDLLGKLHLREE